MVIRGRAPLRVSFGGGGTDVEPFCLEQGGAIIGKDNQQIRILLHHSER